MSNETDDVLKKRRSRRQVLASLGLGAAALYVAPTLMSMGQAEARGRHRSRPSHSRYSRPSYSRPKRSHHHYSRPHRRRWERDGVIEIRLSRLLPRW